jgi:hypothetical protein
MAQYLWRRWLHIRMCEVCNFRQDSLDDIFVWCSHGKRRSDGRLYRLTAILLNPLPVGADRV